MVRKVVLPIVAALLFAFAVFNVVRGQATKAPLPPPAEPSRTPFGHTVAGAGLVEAETENISVGSALAGVVTQVDVKVGQRVKAGDPLFRLDDRQTRAELRVREAALAAAEEQLNRLQEMPRKEELPAKAAQVREGEANLANMEDQYRRARDLSGTAAFSPEEVVSRQQAARVAREQLARYRADYELLKAGAWEPDKLVAATSVEQAKAQVEQTKVDLDRLVVRALVDGEVLQRNVRPGEFVGAPPGQALIVLGDVHTLHVRVDIDEHDAPRFRPGAGARGSLRGDPDHPFPLRFVRVEPYVIPKKSLTGDNTERVDTRVLQVIYAVGGNSEERPLYVGQQMDVFIDAGE
jgi:multidrug resistance efflux pump